MTVTFVLVVFASCLCQGMSSRMKRHLEVPGDSRPHDVTPDGPCPAKVSLNSRDDCIDAVTDAPDAFVASHCCADLRWCNNEYNSILDEYAKRVEVYYITCSLLESDLRPGNDGKYEVADSTRICEPKCKNNPQFQSILPNYQHLESKCHGLINLENLKQRDDLIYVLDDARISCTTTTTTNTVTTPDITTTTTTMTTTTTTTTTTTLTTTTSTTTTTTVTTTTTTTTTTTVTTTTTTNTATTPDYFDFTEFFEPLHMKGIKQVLFPDGNEYFCCCHPNATENSVECVLKNIKVESGEEMWRRALKGRCGGAMGGDYHSWNNVYVASNGKYRQEFVGLENLGKCVVKPDAFPSSFRHWPLDQLKSALQDEYKW